jgi:hypothetical protein
MSESRPKVSIVQFHEDQLQVIDATQDVVLRPACEALGLDPDAQAARLKRQPWACTSITKVHDASGREQEMFCVSLKTVPLWLATIETSRCALEVRPKLERYQLECADVLAAHFLGRAKPAAPAFDFSAMAAVISETVVKTLVPLLVVQGPSGEVGLEKGRQVRRILLRAAKAASNGDSKRQKSEYKTIDNSLRDRFGFHYPGSNWERFPLNRWTELRIIVEGMERASMRAEPYLDQRVLPFPAPVKS